MHFLRSIAEIEARIICEKTFKTYNLQSDTLFFDTTNFFTYIDTTNLRCTIARRGKNKQKRYDLRQVGLAMVVTRNDMIPLFHHTYQGNMADAKVFSAVLETIKDRMTGLGFDSKKHTIVFDRGNNSMDNMAIVERLALHYVGALTPYHHKQLVGDAMCNFREYDVDGSKIQVYHDKRVIWGQERTVVVFISEKLKVGQLRGMSQSLEKAEHQLKLLQQHLCNPKGKMRDKEGLEDTIRSVVKCQFAKDVIDWSLKEVSEGKFQLNFSIDQKKLEEIEGELGFRILMTDHHDWDTADIIKAYYGQSKIEHAFRNLKNPYHLALKPQFHWTDQKIRVHFFICVLGYLMAAIVWYQAKAHAQFSGTLDTLLDTLNNIRLSAMLEETKARGRVKATYKLEEMSDKESLLMNALGIMDFHKHRLKLQGLSVYN
ncbi:IS1634 family transposase [Candidatus Kuenenia stuttgartensis]|uniref:IS1634 family transposase n=1 Tax=Kuenenia stuttgartiensis TaxID=174633 RepID=UPI00146B8A32|nr:IS1634 family transposase [Candidatus Kuenenia stuttgartiensis]